MARGHIPTVAAGARGLQHFRSRPDLEPAAVTVSKASAPASQGDIFVAPQFGPTQDGPMILDPNGKLIWFDANPLSQKQIITDFRVQNLHGQPVLTWFQGSTNSGSGRGEGIIFNDKYQEIATVRAANGLSVDLHEFEITPQGDAYIIAISPVRLPGLNRQVMDARGPGDRHRDRPGAVRLARDRPHPAVESSKWGSKQPGHILDPYHLNSISLDRDGNLLVSARNTSAVYKINRVTGKIMWTLGGKKSSFKMGSGTSFAYQHDAVMQPDGTLTLFDDGGGPPRVEKYSRGLRLLAEHEEDDRERGPVLPPPAADRVGVRGRPAGAVGRRHVRRLGPAAVLHRVQLQGPGHVRCPLHRAVGQLPRVSLQLGGQPSRPPALAGAAGSDGTVKLWASWNGATTVSSWRVLAGPSPTKLRDIGTARKTAFETTITAHNGNPYFAVQALGSKGQVLSTSNTVTIGAHLAIYGQSAFVPSNGLAGLPVGCFRTTPCSAGDDRQAGQQPLSPAAAPRTSAPTRTGSSTSACPRPPAGR